MASAGFFAFGLLITAVQAVIFLFGKEVITVSPDLVTIKRILRIYPPTRSYSLSEACMFRSEAPDNSDEAANFSIGPFNLGNTGIVCFEYGVKTIRFGNELSEAEGNYLLQRMKATGILTDRHFA